jgi:hypothetical protein
MIPNGCHLDVGSLIQPLDKIWRVDMRAAHQRDVMCHKNSFYEANEIVESIVTPQRGRAKVVCIRK